MFNSYKGLLGSALLSAAILAGVSLAHAQPSQPPGTMAQGMGQGMMGQGIMRQGMMRQGMMGMTEPMLEGHLAYVKAELAVTDAQSAAWNAYAGTVRARFSGMQAMHQSMMQTMQSGNAVARMDAHIKATEAMTDTLKALKPATETLYAALTPEQKKKADDLLGMCCMM